jgi:diguanylate cyclase
MFHMTSSAAHPMKPGSKTVTEKPITPEEASVISLAAIEAMRKYRIPPTPDNYLLWYTYSAGDIPELCQEIDQVSQQKVSFTADVNEYLRGKYLAPASGHNSLETATHDTRQIISKVMAMVQEYSGQASSYNRTIGQQAARLEQHGDGSDIGQLLQEITSQLRVIEKSGTVFSSKLDESRKEIESLRQNLDNMTKESKQDFLTGIFNRRALDEMLGAVVEESVQHAKELTLLMVDIDKFKEFNDQWGHQIGDEVLKTVAKALKQCVRGKDIVARYGGEEFCILLPETPVQGARIVAETIRKTIANAVLTRKDTRESMGQITVSIGISRHRLTKDDSIPYFIKRADDALYSAKKAGRNRVVSEV